MTNRVKEKNDKKTSLPTRVIFSWQFWTLIFTLIMMVFFGVLEVKFNKSTPDEWSLGIESLNDAPDDYRKIGQIQRPNNEGITLAYIVKEGIKLVELDWFGEVQRSSIIEIDNSNLRLVDIELESDTYQVYISDRNTLDLLDIDVNSLSLNKESRISNTSEYFDADGNAVIVGDDHQAKILVDNQVVATFSSDTDLKQVKIFSRGERIYAIMDTLQGGKLVMIDGEKVIEKKLTDAVDQGVYGYLKDIHISEGVITVMSSYFKPADLNSTALGVWQMDADTLVDNSFRVFYHVRTSLDPQIIQVEGDKITYILGLQQTIDPVNKGIARFTHIQGGIFTNVSKYTREGDRLIDNTRLTVTRKYPIGYRYYESDKGDVLLWVDRISQNESQFLFAGDGDPWVTKGDESFKVNYSEVVSSTLLTFGGTIFFGMFFLVLYIGLQFKWILGFIVLAFVYSRWFPLEPDKKQKHVFIASILFTMGIKFYITAISNPDINTYAHIYPMFLGNQLFLMVSSITTSLLSVGMIKLWKRQYGYIDSLVAKFSVFLGFEVFFFLYTVGVYILSAMMKNDFMV